MNDIIQRYATCFSCESQNVHMADWEIAATVVHWFYDASPFGQILVINDADLRIHTRLGLKKRYGRDRIELTSSGDVLRITDRDMLRQLQPVLEKATYSHGHYNVVYSPGNMPALWQHLANIGAVLPDTVTAITRDVLRQELASEHKVVQFVNMCKICCAAWLSLSHDAQYVLKGAASEQVGSENVNRKTRQEDCSGA